MCQNINIFLTHLPLILYLMIGGLPAGKKPKPKGSNQFNQPKYYTFMLIESAG